MKKKLYIFRHGQTDANKNNIWQGCLYDLELNLTGVQQARELGTKLSHIQIDIIYSSPLIRARQTAAHVVEKNVYSPPIKIIPTLREGNFGNAEGKSKEELYKHFPQIVDSFLAPTIERWDLSFPGKDSESIHQIFNRAIETLKHILQNEGKIIGVATHGGVLNAIACGLKLPRNQFKNCDVLQLEYNTATDEFTYIS